MQIRTPKGHLRAFIYIPRRLEEIRGHYWFDNQALLDSAVRAAERGDADAAAIVAFLHLIKETDTDNRVASARAVLSRVAVGESGYALFVLACLKFEESRWEQMKHALVAAAGSEFGPAQYMMAIMYAKGVLVSQDWNAALKMLWAARENDYLVSYSEIHRLNRLGKFGFGNALLGAIALPFSLIRERCRHIFSIKIDERVFYYKPLSDWLYDRDAKRMNART